MNKYSIAAAILVSFSTILSLCGQSTERGVDRTQKVIRVESRAVLVDVIVTDSSGKPVTGLAKDAFTLTEQGKPQTISFFEENGAARPAQPLEMPKLPPDVFTNFSPFPQPPAVNVLLLDSLNSRMESQSFVHAEAMKFLKSAKPGTRTAIFTMGLGLHFIQGFNDDPAVLMSALGNKQNNEVESSVMLKGQDESNAQQNVIGMMSAQAPGGGMIASPEMIGALQRFFAENDSSRSSDRMYVTLANLQRLSAFLQGFPGRKNIIWFAEKVPAVYATASDASGLPTSGTPAMNDEIKRTLAMLAAARAAIYPVDARGVSGSSLYTAENNLSKANTQPSQIIGGDGAFVTSMRSDDMERNAGKASAQLLAEQSGGRAFANTNGLSDVIDKVTSDSGYFYTLSYSPTNAKMDGSFRNLEVRVAGGKYSLSYRRGYFAVDAALPGSAMSVRNEKVAKLAGQNPGAVDPLLPFMDLGMPQSEQILYKVRIVPALAEENERVEKKDENHYKVEFAIDVNDLNLNLDTDGLHKGTLNISLVVYDRYGNVISREDHVAEMNMKPDAYAAFQNTGVQLHAELAVPKGNYWLRTGVYDQGSRRVGTMEVALSSVVPLQVSTPIKGTIGTMENEKAKTPVPALPAPGVSPVHAGKQITVEQLENLLANVHGKRDQDVTKQLGGMELSERLSSSRLAKMQAELPGEKSRLALLALADASSFLQLPSSEILATAPPDADTQNLILSRAAEDLANSLHKLPDFFARQTTNRFHDLKIRYLSEASDPIIGEHQAFQPLDSFSATVYYRDGHEVEETTEKRAGIRPRDGLVNWGVFGQLQRIVVTDIYKGRMEWSHWEQRAGGPVAVFQYSIPKEKSNYIVKYCCLGLPNTGLRSFESIPAFHGEITIDPATGAVYRLVLSTDLSPVDPIFRAEIMVEYEPVEIGGKVYICPRKSVTITTAVSEIFLQGGCAGSGVDSHCTPPHTLRPKDTAINDTEYDSYHVFGSEMRILATGTTNQEDKSLSNGAAPVPSVAPGP